MQIVADNLHIVNPAIADAVDRMDRQPLSDLVKRMVAAGADAIDINPGPLKKDGEARMRFLVETVAAVTDKPVLIDTTNAAAIEAGVAASANPVVINGFSTDPEKCRQILPLAKTYDADIIGYLLYPDSGVPTDETDMLNIALELVGEMDAAGVDPAHLIIDPVVAPLMWENGTVHNRSVLAAISRLPDLLGFNVRTIAGISNLTTGAGPKDKKALLEQSYLSMLAAAGLDMALVNVFHGKTVAAARACTTLLNADVFSWAAFDLPGR